MKSLEELKAIREKMKRQMEVRDKDENTVRVVVGMATCGIAAGARPVMAAFLDEIDRRGLSNVSVSQTGCFGVCKWEPMVEVFVPGQEKVTYVHLTPEKVPAIVEQHLINHSVVTEYTVASVD